MNQTINDRPPNFRDETGNLFLVRCFSCKPDHGCENYAPAVASGRCAWCSWTETGTVKSTELCDARR